VAGNEDGVEAECIWGGIGRQVVEVAKGKIRIKS
jgi:hypothetical protein